MSRRLTGLISRPRVLSYVLWASLLVSAQGVQAQVVRSEALNVQYLRAQTAFRSGTNILEAKARVDRVLDALPDDPEARMLRAEVLLGLDRPEEALADAREAVRLVPGHAHAHLIRAEAAHRVAAYDEALAAMEACARIAVEDPLMHLQLSRIALSMDVFELAESYGRVALALAPEMPDAYVQLAHVFMTRGQAPAAVTLLGRGFKEGTLQRPRIEADSLLAPLLTHPDLAQDR